MGFATFPARYRLIVLDDSGSMIFEEKGERIEDLKVILSRVVNAAMLFDDDGISVQFMKWYPGKPGPNAPKTEHLKLDNITSEEDLNRLIEHVEFTGVTPLGSALQARILKPMVLDKISSNALKKPILIIAITDGRPSGETLGTRALHDAISNTAASLSRSQYGVGAVSFQIAQVGNDDPATEWLKALDSDPEVGHLVDVTSSQCPSHVIWGTR